MMRWPLAAILLGAFFAAATPARADSFDPISFGVTASTLGIGVTLERPLLFDLSARVSTGWLQESSQQTFSGTSFNSTFHESNVLVAMDWRPYAGRWRLSGGILFSGDHVDRIAQPVHGTFNFNGNPYAAAGSSATATVSYARPSIYAGVGAGTGILKGLSMAFDAGIVIRNGTSATTVTGPLASNPFAQADFTQVAAGFRTRFIQPVASIGLSFRP